MTEGWGPALLKGGLVIAACFVGFIYVPNHLLTFLTTRVGPNSRDGLVTGFVLVVFVVLAWLFVALQPRRKG